MADTIERYGAIAAFFPIHHILLALKKGGEEIEQADGSVYITKRQWVLPGGGIEPEEDHPYIGALREFTEETGATLEEDHLCDRVFKESATSKRDGVDHVERSILLSIQETGPTFIHSIIDPEIEKCSLFSINELLTLQTTPVDNAYLSYLHNDYIKNVITLNRHYPAVKEISELMQKF